MANTTPSAIVNDSSGVPIDGVDKTADFQSEWMTFIKAGDLIGIMLQILNADGSSMTLDVGLQVTPNDGTDIYDFPQDLNDETQATLTQIASIDDGSAATYVSKYWPNPFPALAGWKWRLNFNFGGTIGTNTMTVRRIHRAIAGFIS